MKKEDLENGMVVVLQDESVMILVDDKFYDLKDGSTLDLCNYNDKMEDVSDKIYNINKVYNKLARYYDDNLLWQRPTIKLSENDINILKGINDDYHYIARDLDGGLYIYECKPFKNKEIDRWVNVTTSDYFNCDILKLSCEDIKWTDEEPFNFREYLNNLEKELNYEY